MFKPFTNTKTCVLFVEKREKNLSDITEAKDDPEVLYAVCESPGKDRSGRLIRDKTGKIVSDLDEIAAYLSENIKWGSK